MVRRPFLRYAFAFGFCLTLALSLPGCGKQSVESIWAPDFTLPTVEGREIALAGLKGKVVLLDFWATWCGPCKESIPHLVQLHRTYHDRGLELIGMSMDKMGEAESVRRFVTSMDIPYPIVMTPDEVGRQYRITGLPTTVLIDRKGKIREKIVGFNDAIGRQITARVAELLSESP